MTTVIHDFTTGTEHVEVIPDDLVPGMTLAIGMMQAAAARLGHPLYESQIRERLVSIYGYHPAEVRRHFHAAFAAAGGVDG